MNQSEQIEYKRNYAEHRIGYHTENIVAAWHTQYLSEQPEQYYRHDTGYRYNKVDRPAVPAGDKMISKGSLYYLT